MGRSYKKPIVFAALMLCALPGLSRAQSLMLGTTYSFTISYANTGTISWGPTTISLQLPPELTYVSCPGAVCSESGGLIQWDIPSVPYGQSGFVTFSAVQTSPETNPGFGGKLSKFFSRLTPRKASFTIMKIESKTYGIQECQNGSNVPAWKPPSPGP